MPRTIEATIDENGTVHLLEAVELPSTKRALVIILEEDSMPHPHEITLLSEAGLTEDWNRDEEEAAWAHLQSDQS
jgi:hypothetical protein